MDKLKSYIENARQKGYSNEQIRTALLRAGWQPGRVDATLAEEDPRVRPADSQAPVERPVAVNPLQADQADDNLNLENLNIDSDKPVTPAQAKKPAGAKKPLLKVLLPLAGFGLIVLTGLIIAGNGFKAYGHTRVPGNFVTTKGQIAFSIPGKRGQYDTRVNFKTPDGATHSFVTPTPPGSNNNSRYVAGDSMKVAYYPRNPDMTALDLTDRGSSIVGITTMIAGAVIAIIGTFFLQRQLRRR
jgi:hypothetical protein